MRKYSNDNQDDAERLYRQMVFNAVVGNTDDHLKNFWMVHDHEQGWRLSTAFDLIPDVGRRGEHVLFFDLGAYYPGRKKLENLGRSWGIRNAEVVVAQVFDAVAGWKEEFAGAGVPEKDIIRFKGTPLGSGLTFGNTFGVWLDFWIFVIKLPAWHVNPAYIFICRVPRYPSR